MKNAKKRIHGRLLMATGIAHVMLAILPGVFGEQFYLFANNALFNVSGGLADLPIIGGTMHFEEFSAFWFFYAGPVMFMYGHVIDEIEKLNGCVSRRISRVFLIVSAIGAYMVPLSGMTFLLIPQGIYMYIRGTKNH